MWRWINQLELERQEDYDTLVNEPKAARYVADFMIKTGLLGQFQAVEPLDELQSLIRHWMKTLGR